MSGALAGDIDMSYTLCLAPMRARWTCPKPWAWRAQVGEIDIDSELVASAQRMDGKEENRIMMLNNGCLCCTVREDLVGMLRELVRRPPPRTRPPHAEP